MASTLIDKADERSREAIEGFDLAASLTAASDLSRAADLIDYTVGRLSRRTSHASSCTDLSISSFLTSLQASAALFKATAMKILRWRNQWLDKEVDELDAVEKALCGGVRMCGAEELGLESILSSLELLVVLYASCDTHVRHSCVVDMVFRGAADVMSNAQSRVQMGIDPHTSKLVLPLAFLPDSPSIATVTFYDNCGVEVIGMEASDVDATVMSYGAPCDTAVVTQLSHSYFQIEFTVTSDALEVVDLHVSAGFCPIEAVPVKVCHLSL